MAIWVTLVSGQLSSLHHSYVFTGRLRVRVQSRTFPGRNVATIRCFVYGSPPPSTVDWTLDGKNVDLSRQNVWLHRSPTCQQKTINGTATTFCRLKVSQLALRAINASGRFGCRAWNNVSEAHVLGEAQLQLDSRNNVRSKGLLLLLLLSLLANSQTYLVSCLNLVLTSLKLFSL